MTIRRTLAILTLVLALCAFTAVAHAGDSGSRHHLSLGLRAGLSFNPDQFVIGAQTSISRVVGPLDFAPSFDAGFGDDVTTWLINGDFVLPFSLPKSNTRLYAGGGPTIAIYDPKGGDNDSEIGVTAVGGIMLPMGSTNAYNLEFRLGFGDIPDVKVLLGIAFGGGKR